MRRLTVLVCALLLLLPAATALAQDAAPTPRPGGSAFQPLPPASQPEATPTPAPRNTTGVQDDTDRRLLFGIAGGLLALFVGIGYVITRDARSRLPERARAAAAARTTRDEGPHRHARQTKAKARAKGKAQKAARRANRPSR